MALSLKLQPRFAARQPRAGVAIEATLLLPDDTEALILIKNISAGGLMGQTDAVLTLDASIGVALPGCGILPARVRWSDAGEIGAQFRRPLDLERLERAYSMAAHERKLFRARILQGPY